jgi:hypothetical protein
MNGLRKCGIYAEKNFNQTEKKNEILSFSGKWMELENIILNLPGSEGQKLHSFFSYVKTRPNISTAM